MGGTSKIQRSVKLIGSLSTFVVNCLEQFIGSLVSLFGLFLGCSGFTPSRACGRTFVHRCDNLPPKIFPRARTIKILRLVRIILDFDFDAWLPKPLEFIFSQHRNGCPAPQKGQ